MLSFIVYRMILEVFTCTKAIKFVVSWNADSLIRIFYKFTKPVCLFCVSNEVTIESS